MRWDGLVRDEADWYEMRRTGTRWDGLVRDGTDWYEMRRTGTRWDDIVSGTYFI